jgi:hypothetical protein
MKLLAAPYNGLSIGFLASGKTNANEPPDCEGCRAKEKHDITDCAD